ncbi:unnamed protein product [Phytomonas sp. Hart1]|nr:unnamed protein product [Phytomonas sp. Hart1]|eukprot:CCW68071.1 unnamed protein product [Phytomonas sp. isolate Hart1]
MESGVLERIRSFEADIEQAIDSMVQHELIKAHVKNDRHRIFIDHFMIQQFEIIRATSDKLLDAYFDEDDIIEARKAPSDGAEVLATAVRTFEGQIADIREYHLAYRDLPPIKKKLSMPDPKVLEQIFSVRERWGACLDLEAHYNRYSAFMVTTSMLAAKYAGSPARPAPSDEDDSLAGLLGDRLVRWGLSWPRRLEYFRFIPELAHLMLHGMDAGRKIVGFGIYRDYVRELLAYLLDFYTRTHPLESEEVEHLLTDTDNRAEEFWAALVREKDSIKFAAESGTLTITGEDGLAGMALPQTAKTACGVVVPPPLKAYVKSCTMWPLKWVEMLIAAANAAPKAEAPGGIPRELLEQLPRRVAEVKEICKTEAKITALLQSLLFHTWQQTETILLRDYSRTVEGIELARRQADKEFLESLEMAGQSTSNLVEDTIAREARRDLQEELAEPKGHRDPNAMDGLKPLEEGEEIPLSAGEANEFIGEDGLPIARWLMKLQQLEKVFVCEVCGGTIYRGPKGFRKHFGAERHTEGLRRLGITRNLKEYKGIASIRAAIEMRDQLHSDSLSLRQQLLEDKDLEELQDGTGKVLTNKEYMQFQRRRI